MRHFAFAASVTVLVFACIGAIAYFVETYRADRIIAAIEANACVIDREQQP